MAFGIHYSPSRFLFFFPCKTKTQSHRLDFQEAEQCRIFPTAGDLKVRCCSGYSRTPLSCSDCRRQSSANRAEPFYDLCVKRRKKYSKFDLLISVQLLIRVKPDMRAWLRVQDMARIMQFCFLRLLSGEASMCTELWGDGDCNLLQWL